MKHSSSHSQVCLCCSQSYLQFLRKVRSRGSLCAHSVKKGQTVSHCGGDLQSSLAAMLTKKGNVWKYQRHRQINSFFHISSLLLAGYRSWHHGLGTRIIQNTSCNVGWWICFSELYISYLLLLPPNVSETTTQPLLHRISPDCHLSDLRKSGLNYMGFLCFNYLGVVGKPWSHFSWLKKAWLVTFFHSPGSS